MKISHHSQSIITQGQFDKKVSKFFWSLGIFNINTNSVNTYWLEDDRDTGQTLNNNIQKPDTDSFFENIPTL